jgi:hypothetical protein
MDSQVPTRPKRKSTTLLGAQVRVGPIHVRDRGSHGVFRCGSRPVRWHPAVGGVRRSALWWAYRSKTEQSLHFCVGSADAHGVEET